MSLPKIETHHHNDNKLGRGAVIKKGDSILLIFADKTITKSSIIFIQFFL